MSGRSAIQTEVNKDLVAWARANLKGIPEDDNYDKMISGMSYAPWKPEYVRHRLESSEKMFEYSEMRLRHFGTVEAFVKAREEYIRNIFGSVGKQPFVEPPLFIDYGYNVKVGDNFYTNFNVTLLDCSVIEMGDNVWIGPGSTITTACHPLESKPRSDGVEFSYPVRIGNNVWIGANATILPGVTIGNDVVVAAGAVVSKDVPDSVVVGGVPARVLKHIEQTESPDSAEPVNRI